jgi:hypothetical protein
LKLQALRKKSLLTSDMMLFTTLDKAL